MCVLVSENGEGRERGRVGEGAETRLHGHLLKTRWTGGRLVLLINSRSNGSASAGNSTAAVLNDTPHTLSSNLSFACGTYTS